MNITQFWEKHYDKLKKYWYSFRSFRNWIGKRNHIDFELDNVFCVDDMIFMRKTQLQGELKIVKQPEGNVVIPETHTIKGHFQCGKCKQFQAEKKRTGFNSKTGWFCSDHDKEYTRAYVNSYAAGGRWGK